MNRDLAYKCQMLPASIRKSKSLATTTLLKSGWPLEVIASDLEQALSWANSHCMVQQQEKTRRTRDQRKKIMRGDDALDAMFSSVGANPAEIPRRKD